MKSDNALAGATRQTLPESFWRSLRYFNGFRLVTASIFVLAVNLPGRLRPFGAEAPLLSFGVSLFYLAAAVCFVAVAAQSKRPRFYRLLTIEVVVDVLSITLLMYASGGARSGLGYMLLVVMAAAGLVGHGRLALFYAALATVAVLFEQAYHLLQGAADLTDLSQAGLICIGFFGTAISAHLLARRAVANEILAEERRMQLAMQLRVGDRIIRDMQDGILVVEGDGRVRQYNPQAAELCEISGLPEHPTLALFSPRLAERFSVWSAAGRVVEEIVAFPGNRSLRVRYLPPEGEDSALVYLSDLARVQAQAQQIKLAALGRLTANMAHEIRNPLAAISHASELLHEGAGSDDVPTQQRLSRIVKENAERLNRLVTDVLELGRRDRTSPEALGLAVTVEAFIDEFSLLEPDALRIVDTAIAADVRIRFDRGHLNRVLANLVGNAMRYCSREDASVRVVATRAPRGPFVYVDVWDDGSGIPEDARAHVFEPFFTTRSTGTGLGLYIAKELCEANGGGLELLNPTTGTGFRIIARGEDDDNTGS